MKKTILSFFILVVLAGSVFYCTNLFSKYTVLSSTGLQVLSFIDTVPASKGCSIRSTIKENEMNDLDKDILVLANLAARRCEEILQKAMTDKIKTEEEIFSTLYFPVTPLSTPPTFHTFYDDYTDKFITPLEDSILFSNDKIIFVALVDVNGYLPSHNTKFSEPRTGIPAYDLLHNRTKRIFNDITGFTAAKSCGKMLIQTYQRDTGENIADMSVPVYVNGKPWGALRIGYKRFRQDV